MQKEDPSFADIFALIIKSTVKKVKKLSSHLDEINHVKSNSNRCQTDQSHSAFEMENKYQTIIDALHSELHAVKLQVQRLNDENVELKENYEDLKLRLDSITDETRMDMDALKNSLEDRFRECHEKEIQSIHSSICENPKKMYFEASTDGRYLINGDASALSSNFIELDIETGRFTIYQSPESVEYLIVNKDYALAACDVILSNAKPTSVRVDEMGMATQCKSNGEWQVTKKLKITLY